MPLVRHKHKTPADKARISDHPACILRAPDGKLYLEGGQVVDVTTARDAAANWRVYERLDKKGKLTGIRHVIPLTGPNVGVSLADAYEAALRLPPRQPEYVSPISTSCNPSSCPGGDISGDLPWR